MPKTPRTPVISGLHSRGYLPHLKVEGSSYFVTFRLTDSLPRALLDQLRELKADHALQRESSSLPSRLAERLDAWDELIEQHLDQSSGACWLRDSRVADLVAAALRHFHGVRYQLNHWVIMPNHVHAVLHPLPPFALERILHGWKSFTAHRANQLLGRRGAFWQRESYDHWIRDDLEFERFARYTEDNPVKARLCARPADWRWSSAAK